jgi:uncharacterized damage-inducible protein DinB
MQDVAFYRRLYAYNYRVLDGYLRRMSRMSWKDLSKNHGTGHLSMKDTMAHIIRVHDGWLNYVVQNRMKEFVKNRKRPQVYSSCKDLRRHLEDVWKGIDALLAGLADKDLGRIVKAPWMPGRYTLADALMQASLEQAHHIGELIGVFWQMDAPPPQMMWIPILERKNVRVY